jgi:hypothetical protein
MRTTTIPAALLLALALPASGMLAQDPQPPAPALVEIELDGNPDSGAEPQPQAPPPRSQAPSVSIAIGGDRERQPRDAGSGESPADDDEPSALLHGFRLGYLFVMNHDEPIDQNDPDSSLERQYDVRSPHQFLIGYEVANRLTNQGWLNVLLVGNLMIGGLEQSKFFPSANLLLGFEFDESFQTGVGVNLAPVQDKAAHMVIAAGWTPKVGELYLPVHVFYVPDVDGNHRLGATIGVNWGS